MKKFQAFGLIGFSLLMSISTMVKAEAKLTLVRSDTDHIDKKTGEAPEILVSVEKITDKGGEIVGTEANTQGYPDWRILKLKTTSKEDFKVFVYSPEDARHLRQALASGDISEVRANMSRELRDGAPNVLDIQFKMDPVKFPAEKQFVDRDKAMQLIANKAEEKRRQDILSEKPKSDDHTKTAPVKKKKG